MQNDISERDRKQARHPHEIFLINLISNHILLFVALLGMAKLYPAIMLVTPLVSLVVLIYLILRARYARQHDSWFVMCHWQLCARRSGGFILMLLVMMFVIMGILTSVGWDMTALRPGHYAFAGVAIFPIMISVLALIIMESDAMHQARSGTVSAALAARYPPLT